MNFLSALFPGPAAAGEVIKQAAKGIDNLFYTDQEKAEDKQQAKREAAGMYMKWMEATSGQNRARRAIALVVTALWALTFLAALVCDVAAPWVGAEYRDALSASAEALRGGAGQMSTPFTLILGFYFGQRMLDAFRQTPKGGK